ncbi:glycoside hydrolase family 15 protein [Bdellovibrionota bacterium FG-1]
MSSLPLSDYGLIGNQSSAALINRLGSVEWCCFPYLDSPSHFGAILDDNQGGRFQIAPTGDFRSEQRYLQRTHVLETVFETPSGRGVLTDWMPMDPHLRQDPIIFRRVEILNGKVDWTLTCAPRFGYGAHAARAEQHRGGILFRGTYPDELAGLRADVSLTIPLSGTSVTSQFSLEAGQKAHFTWAWGRRANLPQAPSPTITADYWRGWAHRCPPSGCLFAGPWHDAVTRSALVFKLLSSAHSGAIAEAVTTSIPGTAGTSRNWDYRYAWIRDGAVAIQALAHLGYRDEANEFFLWLSDIITRDGAEGLQPVYSLDGGKDLPEKELPFLSGYQGSRPVRIGNHSARQFQLDIYGHILITASEYFRLFGELPPGLWPKLSEVLDYVCQAWRRPDHGPWEARAKAEHYAASKIMCWAALDRGISLAAQLQQEAPARWNTERQILRQTICQQAYDSQLLTFTSAFGKRDLDASVLQIPLIGFLPFDDIRVQNTLNTLQQNLSDGVILQHFRNADGQSETDSAQLVTSFLFISCLALSGRVEEASDRLAELCTYSTPLGLFGEQINLETHETTGNFPSAAVHLSLMNAALYVGVARSQTQGAVLPLTTRLIGMPELTTVRQALHK